MGSLSDYAELELLDHVFNAAYSPVATIYLALCTADPTDAGTGASMNEVTNSNGYARKAITFAAAATRAIAQTGNVTFDTVTGAGYGPVTHWAVVDSGTHGAGNMLAHGSLSTSKTLVAGNVPSVASGQVTITFSAGEISDYLSVKLLDLMFRNTAYSKPATYVALTTDVVADDDDGDSITEVSGGSYARKQVNINGGSSPTWDLAASGVVDNTHVVTFITATASWGTVTSVAVLDASTSGNLLFYDNAMTNQAVTTDDTVSFGVGDLDIVMS